MKRVVIIVLALLVISTFIACNKQASKDNIDTEKDDVTPIVESTPNPTDIQLPILKPAKVITQWGSIYKIYENGEYGFLGYQSLEDRFSYYEKSYMNRMIEKDTIKAEIPVIVNSSWDYERIKADKHEVIMKSNVNKSDYNQKYGKKLDEIKARYKMDKPITSVRIQGFDKCSDNHVYLLDTDVNGAVFVHFGYCDSKGNHLDYCNRDMFNGHKIVDVAIGMYHVVALTDDGKVLSYIVDDEDIAKEFGYFTYGQEETDSWTDIVDVSTGDYHTIALKKDGTVVACGDNNFGQLDVSDWSDIIAIEAGDRSSFGIKSDGGVVVAGTEDGAEYHVDNWKDIVQIKTGVNVVAGLNKSGEIFITGSSPIKEKLNWNKTKEPIFSDIIAMDFIFDTLVVMDKDGGVDFASVYDYLFNTEEYTTDIDDIAAINTYSYAVKKGNKILSASSDKVDDDWDDILDNEVRYEVLSYIEQVVKFEINDDGDLLLNEQQNQKRQALFDYDSKIVDYKVVDIFGRYIIAMTEEGDALFVSYDYSDLSFYHEVIFDSHKEGASIKKIFSNRQVVVLLDDKGHLHQPFISKLKLNSNFVDVDWGKSTNWDRDKNSLSKNNENSVQNDAEIMELSSWDEFEKLFDGDLPKLKKGRADSFYKSKGKSSSTAGAWFHDCSQNEFDNYIKLLLSSGFKMDLEHDSMIADADNNEYPIVIKELIYTKTGAELEVDITDYGEQLDVSIAFVVKG